MSTIKTILHSYSFDTAVASERAEWQALQKKLLAMGLGCFHTLGGKSDYVPALAGPIDLETSHLFDNQWNTPTHRVFDWAMDYEPNHSKTRMQGHWLEQTEEMREVRRNTAACGYCGKQEPAAKGYVFCPHCLGFEYLTEKNLFLTRMRAVDDTADRAPLTEAEHAHLLPLFQDAQLHGTTDRDRNSIADKRARIESAYKKTVHHAKVEHDGFLWFMDRGVKTDNLIYYSHIGKFSFGWRKPCDTAFVSGLLDVITEFPFAYEIKCADGKTLTAE